MSSNDATLDRLHAAVDEFYQDETTRTEDSKLLLRYLAAKPSFAQPVDILAVDEIETRIEIVQHIQNFIQELKPDWHVTAVRLAIFMVMPMGTLLKLKDDLVTTSELSLVAELESTHMLVIDFFQKMSRASKEIYAESVNVSTKRPRQKRKSGRKEDEAFLPNLDEDGNIRRNVEEKKVCVQREGNSCLTTSVSYPEACHIVPFSFNSNDTNMAATRVTISGACKLLGPSSLSLRNLLGQELGSSDRSWNMIALSPLAHMLWGRGLFAFKCLGVIHDESLATVQLQFRWMAHQSKSPDPHREIDLEDSEAVAQDIARYAETTSTPPSKEGAVGLANIITSRGVFSGDIFEIKMPYDQALKMKEMLGLQWAMISLLALSGAAGSPELLREPDRPSGGAASQIQDVPGDSKHVQQERQPRSPSRHATVQDYPALTQRPISQLRRPALSPVRISRYSSPEKQGVLKSPTLEQPTSPKSPMSPERLEENMPPWEFNPAF